MSEKNVQLNEEAIKEQLKELVRGSVEETLNELLEAEAQKQRPRRLGTSAMSSARVAAAATYSCNLAPTPGDVPGRCACPAYGGHHRGFVG